MTDKIERGHVCEHGIRWPAACQPCDDAAWSRHQSSMTEELQGRLPDHLLAIADTMVDQGHHTKAALVVASADAIRSLLASLTAKDAEIAALRAALEPFGEWGAYVSEDGYGPLADDDVMYGSIKPSGDTIRITAGHLRAARALHENPESKA